MATLSGSVERIVFRNPDSGFCVARFQQSDVRSAGLTTIVGTLPSVRPGEMLRLDGDWEVHPIHGRNFRVERYEEEMPSTLDGIERYLASGVIRGVGPVTAARIVEEFGERAINVIDEEPELLRRVPGVSAKRLEVIKESWINQKRVRDLAMFLQDHGLSVALAQRIHDMYGERAADIIREDPYRLAHDIHGVGFRTADAVARTLGIPPDSLSRYVAGLKYALSDATDEGHVYLPRPALLDRAMRVLRARREELEPALLELLRRGDAVIDEDAVYLTPFYRAESGAARLLARIRETPSALSLDPRFDAAATVTGAAAAQGLILADKQLLAAEQALREKVSLLTGGPGTGKTSTLRTIISALEAADISFCLCAPTGRAAKRVAETTGRPASTIHRLLAFQPATGLFVYDRHRPLPYDFIVVDEVSMLDILLFYHLLKAVPPESHLLLVGDADQLPAVGPGSVLRDLLQSETVPTVVLTELFRQARDSQIVLAAHSVNQGEIPSVPTGRNTDFFFVEVVSDEEALRAIERLVTDRIPTKFGFDPVDDVQVLAPMHNGPVGVTALNGRLQLLLNPPRPGVPELTRGLRSLRPGDKVMQIRNNYDKDIYNGDVGQVVAVNREEQMLTVSFGTGSGTVEVEYQPGELDELVLAYAASVHKAQGSEFPCVVMPVVTRHFMLLPRNLLYTAITRARQLCVLVGSRKALEVAVGSRRRESRNSQLARRLRASEQSLQLDLV